VLLLALSLTLKVFYLECAPSQALDFKVCIMYMQNYRLQQL